MKSNTLLKIFAIIFGLPLLVLIFGGCSEKGDSQVLSEPPASVTESSTEPISVLEECIAENAPAGDPTFLIGLDGKAILTSEITRLENAEKTAETLTENDLGADVYCDGFSYYAEPSAAGYDKYHNPELFDGYKFLGEAPENVEWKRVNVGDEICGLKVTEASAHFYVNDWDYTVPERYFDSRDSYIRLDGTVVAEGFLQVNNRSVMYPDTDELVWFYPVKFNFPITPSASYRDDDGRYEPPFNVSDLYNQKGNDLLYASAYNYITFGTLGDIGVDPDGLGTGDIAYVRVTIGNLECHSGGISAKLENVERLSDILAHNDDDTEAHQPAPTM